MAYTHLITEVGERFVGSITLNRPDHLNTFNSLLAEELAKAKQQAADPNTQWADHESVWETLHEQYDV